MTTNWEIQIDWNNILDGKMINKKQAEKIATDYLQTVLEYRSDQIRAHPRVTWEVVTPTYTLRRTQRERSVWVITFALDPVNQGDEPFLYVYVGRETGKSQASYRTLEQMSG